MHACVHVKTGALSVLAVIFLLLFVLEPLLIVLYDTCWVPSVMSVVQKHEFSRHSEVVTKQHQKLVEKVECDVFDMIRGEAATRIQRRFRELRDRWQTEHKRQTMATLIQTATRKLLDQKHYGLIRMWCLRVEVVEIRHLRQVYIEGPMNPVVVLKCDAGNCLHWETEIAWESHDRAQFSDDHFTIDIKDSSCLQVSVWSRHIHSDLFIGRLFLVYDQWKLKEPKHRDMWMPIYDVQHIDELTGEPALDLPKYAGEVRLRFSFWDPLKEDCGVPEREWVLPHHQELLEQLRLGADDAVVVASKTGLIPELKSDWKPTSNTRLKEIEKREREERERKEAEQRAVEQAKREALEKAEREKAEKAAAAKAKKK
eukprot:GDKI01003393.1.p1 GENE.GDKI01003393.1~~GDKI01003393.1.p1  ORF type:complete len:370 (-),score=79.90 GDKI01003393.1:173-1282(-)